MRGDKFAGLQAGALICAVAIAAGCSGGGASSPAPATKSGPPATTSSAKKYDVSIQFTTGISSKAENSASRVSATAIGSKRRQYVSPATLGAIITATSTDGMSANNTTLGYDLSSANSACTFSEDDSSNTVFSVICRIVIPLAADTYSLQLVTYDQNQSSLSGAGNALSIDVEPETVSAGTSNSFTFNPHAYVVGFDFEQEENGDASKAVRLPGRDARVRAKQASHTARGPLDLTSSTNPAQRVGAASGESTSFDIYAGALDRDLYFIDQYPGDATFANGVFYPMVTESGDTTGCNAASPCSAILSANGSTYPVLGPTPGPDTPSVTISNAETDQEDLTFAYYGGGGPGAGIENWKANSSPSGQQPYSVDYSIPNAIGSFGNATPFVQPNFFVSPIYAYSTDGAGNMTFTAPAGGGTIYVWGAQAIVPDGASSYGSSYYASFSDGIECDDSHDNTVMQIGGLDFAAGYGELFEIDVRPNANSVSCLLVIHDGLGDSASVTLKNTPQTAAAVAPYPRRSINKSYLNLLGSR